jgi:carbon-monoxide dehydrogenase medium subunit
MSAFRYISPSTLEHAVGLLAGNAGARALAGGHTLLLEPSRNRLAGSLLVDLGKIRSLAGVEKQDAAIILGAMTTIGAIAEDQGIRCEFPALSEAALLVGDAQVRNRATVGGSVATCDPEADLPAVLLALDARLQIMGSKASRELPIGQFFVGSGQSALQAGEVIVSIKIPRLGSRSGTAYEKFKNPATLNAICGVAAVLTLGQKDSLKVVRIGVTGATDHPVRLLSVERQLSKTSPTDESITAASSAAGDGLTFREDLFASAEYRQHLMNVLTKRALKRAVSRATT